MNQQNELPVAYTLFCDDLRQEVGNKVSYMGVYQGMMYVQAFPTVLAKLCAAVTVRFPREIAIESLVFKLFLQDEVIAERSFDPQALKSKLDNDQGQDVVMATALFQIVPFSIEEPAVLKSRVYFDTHELKAGGLSIRSAGKVG
jgi:hypothetical protein